MLAGPMVPSASSSSPRLERLDRIERLVVTVSAVLARPNAIRDGQPCNAAAAPAHRSSPASTDHPTGASSASRLLRRWRGSRQRTFERSVSGRLRLPGSEGSHSRSGPAFEGGSRVDAPLFDEGIRIDLGGGRPHPNIRAYSRSLRRSTLRDGLFRYLRQMRLHDLLKTSAGYAPDPAHPRQPPAVGEEIGRALEPSQIEPASFGKRSSAAAAPEAASSDPCRGCR